MGDHLETVDVKTQVLGLRPGVTLETGHGTSGTGSRWWGHPGDCGHVTQSAVSEEKADSGDWTCDPCIWSGRGSSWILQTIDIRYRIWEGGHNGDCGHVTQVQGLGRVVILGL